MYRAPCKACRLRHKKCVWKDYDVEFCDRCSKMEIECNSIDLESITLAPEKKQLSDLKNMWTTIDQLESEMRQLKVEKAQLDWNLTAKQHPRNEWQLSITDGVVKLETPIQTIEELAMFSQASLRYLSPFIGLFNKQPIRFEASSISITHGLSFMIHRREMLKPRRKRFEVLGYNSNDQHIQRSTQPNQSTMDYLVRMYLKHHNSIVGFLHQPTFLKYYHNLDDPMDSALALAVCVDALARIGHLLMYTPNQACILAENFCARCKDLLFDMYEDPTQKFQVIVVTSLLQQYLGDVVLNHLESNRLVTLALMVCADLAKSINEMTRVERVLYQRHYFHLELVSRTFQMVFEDKIDFTRPVSIHEMEALDDEPEKTKQYVSLINHLFRLFGTRYVSEMTEKISHIFYGEPCDIPLEDVLCYESFVMEWWISLPEEHRLCDNPFDPDAYKHVEGKVPPNLLLPFTVLHTVTGIFASSILQPHVKPRSEDPVSMDAIELIRKKSISLAINSCKVLVYALKENWDPLTSDLPSVALSVLTDASYCCEKISGCQDIEFPLELLSMLTKSLNVKLKGLLPSGHVVPSSSSLLISYLETSKKSPYELYEQYPSPGDALVSDVLLTTVNRLMDRHLTVSYQM